MFKGNLILLQVSSVKKAIYVAVYLEEKNEEEEKDDITHY
ncbi:hypothetical protein N752_17215 [Desulforamulus aquiferis]|nr:hypothetical protein N752_17215 [Desulforamulus aquiferis]